VSATYLLDQSVDGTWHATPVDGGETVTIDGWQQIAAMLDEHTLRWREPTALARFRSQFGEPPADLDLHRMGVAEPA
jgi:hypothetical protein